MSSKPIEIHFEKSLNNLNLVQQADVGQRREFLIVTALVILMALGIIAYGWMHYQTLDLSYRIEAATREKAQLVKIREKLRSEHQFLRSSERIDQIARQRLGMVVAAPGQMQLAPAGLPSATPDTEMAARQ